MKGFTLVEVMISVVILGLGASLIANTYIVALRGVNTTQNSIQALILAREQFAALELSSLRDGLAVSTTEGKLKCPLKDYDYVIDVAEITQLPDLAKDFVRGCLELSWRQAAARRSIALSSYFLRQKE